MDLPYNPAIPLLDIDPKETRIERDTCTSLFIAALFTIARMWGQPRCPSADEWIRKLWYIYTMEYYSVVKSNTLESVLMRWMNLKPIIQSEVSQKENKYMLMREYGISKDGTDEPIRRAAMETQTWGTDLWTQSGKERVG